MYFLYLTNNISVTVKMPQRANVASKECGGWCLFTLLQPFGLNITPLPVAVRTIDSIPTVPLYGSDMGAPFL